MLGDATVLTQDGGQRLLHLGDSGSVTGIQGVLDDGLLGAGGFLVLKNGLVDVGGGEFKRTDVSIEDGRIAAIGEGAGGGEVVDCTRFAVVPGIINSHSHSNENWFRGRFDNPGTNEGNFGLGFRTQIDPEWIIGGYGYFDIQGTDHDNTFYQVTLGLEALSVDWDFRVNGYIPTNSQQMGWSDPAKIVIAKPTFTIVGSSSGSQSTKKSSTKKPTTKKSSKKSSKK